MMGWCQLRSKEVSGWELGVGLRGKGKNRQMRRRTGGVQKAVASIGAF